VTLQPLMNAVARTRRVTHRLGLLDLMGHISVRSSDGQAAVATPRYGIDVPPPIQTGPDDIVVVDFDAERRHGRHAPPLDLQIDLALYRARPEVRAVLLASPPELVAFGAAKRQLLPVTHYQADLVLEGAAFFGCDGPVRSRDQADSLVREMNGRSVCHLPGLGVVIAATSLADAVSRLHALEQIAVMNLSALSLCDTPRTVSQHAADVLRVEMSAALERDVAAGYHGAIDASRFYESFDEPYRGGADAREQWPDEPGETNAIRRRVALACRILDRQGTLVGYLEHVSHRASTSAPAFAMSPAKRFASMLPSDIGLVSMEGDCPPIDGPLPPAPFRLYHRDVFDARPTVNAIVHTHEMYGRALVMGGHTPQPIFRVGAVQASELFRCTVEPSLAFSEQNRRLNVALLGDGSALHILSHGTDFVAPTLEEAVVDAVQREQLARINISAARLGEPKPLSKRALSELERDGPTYADWWRYYASDT